MELKSSKAPEEEFLLVDTISKMPISLSFMTQDIFENPSPLQNNFNVAYKFNSISGTDINISKWGLEALPMETTKILNILGINSESLKKIEANTVTPQRILKLRKQAAENGELDIKVEDLMSTGTALYRTMGTQTTQQSSNNSKDIGTQTKPLKENTENNAIWQNPTFDIINLTQTQTNVMFALKELSECMPNQLWAEQLYKPLRDALFIKRNAIKDPRLTRNSYN
ncbi:protein panoramix [Drosophila tropicalis]|uniref:protein panoramix n=1 Tax=Drosophila tropicalis TaxID=46794 RepID=UPI0035AC1AB0